MTTPAPSPDSPQEAKPVNGSGPPPPNRIGRGWFVALIAAALLGLYLLVNAPLHTARSPLGVRARGGCRAYAEAQVMFKRNDWDGDKVLEYTPDFTKLYSTKDGAGLTIDLIDEAFAAAKGPKGAPKNGYRFDDMKTIAGKPIDWKRDYGLCAVPAVYGLAGKFVLIVKTDGRVWAKDLGESRFVTDFPADPIKAGWQDADDVDFDDEQANFRRYFALLLAAGVVVVAFLVRAAWWVVRASAQTKGKSRDYPRPRR